MPKPKQRPKDRSNPTELLDVIVKNKRLEEQIKTLTDKVDKLKDLIEDLNKEEKT